MRTIQSKIEVAWALFQRIISKSNEALLPIMTHPCGEQYECLSALKDENRNGATVIDINLNGTGILVRSDILRYSDNMTEAQIDSLSEEIIEKAGLLKHEPCQLFGIEFARRLLATDFSNKLYIANAWYDGSYSCYLTQEAKTFYYYPVPVEQDRFEHIPWWTISSGVSYRQRVHAICNFQTDEVITATGQRFDLKLQMKEALKAMKTLIQSRTPRGLSTDFQTSLKSGTLYPILQCVHRDNNITIEVRSNYINLYYRGGNLLRIREKNPGYRFEFDIRYIKEENQAKKQISSLPEHVVSADDVHSWVDMIPTIKSEMDTYFVKHKKTEREFQQLVVRENNIGGIAGKTDYFICDIEYQTPETRFDLIAAKRAGRNKFRLALIEMKYADSALGGESGIIDHVRKAYAFIQKNSLEDLKIEMLGILETKRSLGLIDGLPDQISFTDEIPEFTFLLANHQPASNILDVELSRLNGESFFTDFCKMAELKFATSNFFGYGLFSECAYTSDEFESLNHKLLDIQGKRCL